MTGQIFADIEEAARSVNEHSELGYVLHVPIHQIHELSSRCQENVVLCSTSGEYSCEGFKEGVITGFSYDRSLGEVVEIDALPAKSKTALERAYKHVKTNSNAFVLLLLDGLTGREESVMTTLYFMDKDFKVIGGSAGDSLMFKETAIYIGGKRVSNVAVFFNMKKRTALLKENIYNPIGEKILVTEADPINRIVYKLNNVPAATEYARILGIREGELSNHFINHPLGKIYEEDILIASPMKVNPDKSITFYCQVMPNTFLRRLEPVDVVDRVRQTMASLPYKPQFMYVLNCILRSLKFQQEGTWKAIDREILGTCSNVSGFISYGEQFYRHHINQTMVVLAVE